MVIIFYDGNNDKLYICSDNEKTRIVDKGDPELMNYIPNDDILYVRDGHYFTKPQFQQYLNGEINIAPQKTSRFAYFTEEKIETPQSGKITGYYIHPTNNGSIIINDLKKKDGQIVEFNSKWDFVAVDDIGEEALSESVFFNNLLAKKKLEIVDAEYVKNNIHKGEQKVSPVQAELNKILVPTDIRAEAAAEMGGIDRYGSATPIFI